MSEERCVMCGEVIPEGRQVCHKCQSEVMAKSEPECVYIVENENAGDFKAFRNREDVSNYIRQYYCQHFLEWYNIEDLNANKDEIAEDFKLLNLDVPYIPNVMYVYKTELK